MDWKPSAGRLAEQVTRAASAWRGPVAAVPRHLLVPRWWVPDGEGWTLRDGPADEAAWLDAAYSDTSLVTRVGPRHADHADPGDHTAGRPTSSATLPGLVVRMLRHADVEDGHDVLDVGTGSGYSAAVLSHRLGAEHVTSVDVDPYLTQIAAKRLREIGLHPTVTTVDATGPLPERAYDRIVSMVSVRPIPPSWLAALRPGGRLVTVMAGTTLIVTANKTPDGGAVGRTEWDRAGFMTTRTGADYDRPPDLADLRAAVRGREDGEISQGRYPVLDVHEAWDVSAMLELAVPGIEHDYQEDTDGRRTAWMLHADGSWARATAATASELPIVHQGGPRHLWNELDRIRHRQVVTGELPVRGATVRVDPDGACHLRRGRWEATIA